MNEKKDLILDYDSTMVNSEKAFCEVYNHLYRGHKGFVEADWRKSKAWDFGDVCPLIHEEDDPQKVIREIFASEMFFDVVDFYPNAYDILKELDKHYNLIVCTIGTPLNIARKIIWLERRLPFIQQLVPVVYLNGQSHGKELVNMKGAIFMDDNIKNLETSNAEIKIFHNERMTENGTWSGKTTLNWLEVHDLLIGKEE